MSGGDDEGLDDWEPENWEKLFEAVEEAEVRAAAARSTSSTTTTNNNNNNRNHEQQQQHELVGVSCFSPPRELSQRIIPINNNNTLIINHNHHDDHHHDSKDHEIHRLKMELERVSGHVTQLEQECSMLKNHRCQTLESKSDFRANCGREPTTSTADCHDVPLHMFQNTKDEAKVVDTGAILNSEPIGIPSLGVSDGTNLGISDGQSNSRAISEKLQRIWSTPSYQELGRNVISRLFVVCADDFRVIFGCMGVNVDSLAGESSSHAFHMDSSQTMDTAKVSYFYSVMTQTGNGMLPLETLFEPLLDLFTLENVMIVHRSLRVLHMLLKHLFTLEKSPSRSALYSGIIFWWRENAPEKMTSKFTGMTAQKFWACFVQIRMRHP